MRSHNTTLVVLGTFSLWFRWYGFNIGSFLQILTTSSSRMLEGNWLGVGQTSNKHSVWLYAGSDHALRKAAAVRQLECSRCLQRAAGRIRGHHSRRSVVDPGPPSFAGFVATWVLIEFDILLLRLKFDDPLAAQLHDGCRAWRLIFTGGDADSVLQNCLHAGLGLN